MHFVLQEKDGEPGDYIVRARGAWFGNRSISAEVDLERGVYEVVPKIEAKRDADSPDVHEVVTKVAERNPQKLRQIGMNYDLANAKGLDQLTEEERKLADKRKKEASERKRKEKEVADKDKADFEAWKKEEKAEYEAWKREKKRLGAKSMVEKAESDVAGARSSPLANTDARTSDGGGNEKQSITPAAQVCNPATTEGVTPGVKQSEHSEAMLEAELVSKTKGSNLDGTDAPSNDDEAENVPDKSHELPNRGSPEIMNTGRHHPPYLYRPVPRFYGDESGPRPISRPRSPVNDGPKPWNAVCVLGLRIYSQDSSVSIKLVKPKNAEEGAILDVGGDTAAGATM